MDRVQLQRQAMTTRLNRRVRNLEHRLSPTVKQWVRILQYENQTTEQA